MEPNGEYLLQLLQGGGDGRSSSRRMPNGDSGASSSTSLLEQDSEQSWQHHRDPAVAALGPSHSYHAQGEPLFMPPPAQYGGGVWTPPQQQQQFFTHGFGPRPPHRFPPFPPSAQLAPEQQPWRSESSQGWLPPPHHAARGPSDGGIQARYAGPMQQSNNMLLKAPAAPQQQQFLGNGAELLQLLLGGGSQTLKPSKPAPEELVDNSNVLVPRAQVHGPIGPPKRSEALASEGGEDLLGRFWALPNGDKPSLAGTPEEQMRSLALSGGFDASKTSLKSKGSKLPPGFFRDSSRDGLPIDPSFVSSTVKALNHFSREQFQDGTTTTDLKQENSGRPSDDRGNYQMQQNASRFVRNREDGHLKTSGQAREDLCTSADVVGNESSSGRIGARASGRRGGRAEVGRSAGRLSTGQWVARNSEREGSTSNLQGPDAERADSNASGSAYSSPQAAKAATTTALASGKDESSPNGSGGKSKEDMKRRRGQIQEWRMKQASPPHSKPNAEPGFQAQQDGNLEAILPLASQVDRPGLPSNTVRHSMPGSATDESKQQLQYQLDEGVRTGGRERAGRYLLENGRLIWEDGFGGEEEEELNFPGYTKLVEDTQQFSTTPPVKSVSHLTILTREEAELEEKPGNLRDSREVRRHQQRMNVPTILTKGDVQRPDFETFNPQLLAIYKSLIPSQEEVQRQRKFLTQLDRLVSRDWDGAKLFLFGSCANDFGVRNSDIDVCLSVDDENSSKAELVTKMAAILRSDNMQNVQALTHARVPIVKFTDPDTGINCDICVNNMLAVVNSKLLHDYSQVDPRLRQLAFMVKHWAKQRQVNETYRGTLSSYAYVLMCIHFLQQRRPAILPCLQSMQPTYEVTVGTIKCAYFDKVNTLKNFGARNKESVAELLTYFFEYWASCHDYNRWVISIRTGGYLSKDEKDWTRRIGNERHLICIEDPFEVTHDLGRVVDRHSIRVLRDEFKRAARIMRQDPNPATALFEPFIRDKV